MAGARYMYGFVESAPYTLLVTDWSEVWIDSPTRERVHDKAVRAGVADFDDDKLRYLVAQLAQRVALGLVRFAGREKLVAEATVNATLAWHFDLERADAGRAARFFRDLARSGVANHCFLLYKVRRLEAMVRARDQYTLYLEENYKTINGTELMDKYRRQHRDEAEVLAPYSRTDVDDAVLSGYKKLEQTDPWDDIEQAVGDRATWRALKTPADHGARVKLEPGAITRKRPHLGPEPSVKREHTDLPSLPTKALQSNSSLPAKPQLPEASLKDGSPQLGSSPRRRRLGLLRR